MIYPAMAKQIHSLGIAPGHASRPLKRNGFSGAALRQAAVTPEMEFQRLRQACRKLDVRLTDLRLRQEAGWEVTHKVARTCEQRTGAMKAIATLAGMMNRRATE